MIYFGILSSYGLCVFYKIEIVEIKMMEVEIKVYWII